MRIVAEAPSRIDLAGGTVDIYPIYLLEDGAMTVNMATTIASRVIIEPAEAGRIELCADDLGKTVCVTQPWELPLEGELELVARVVRFYGVPDGVRIRTHNDAPHGSGLGASSSLLICLSGALRELNGQDIDDRTLVMQAMNIEVQNIKMPAGRQDYYPALLGGVNALWFDAHGDTVYPIENEALVNELERRLILTFTGESRLSTDTNWEMLKKYIEGEEQTVSRLHAIRQVAIEMKEALEHGDLKTFAELLDQEWQNRRGLAEGVSTEQIEKLMAAAKEAGALASKVCGAGGGGCMISFAAEGKEQAVREALERAGGQVLDYKVHRRGLTVRREE